MSNIKRFIGSVICVALLITSLSACGSTPSGAANANQSDTAHSIVSQRIISQRIISLTPAITEILVALGLSDSIIAVDAFATNIKGMATDLKLPEFDAMSPDNERILAMKPDIVFVTEMSFAGGDDPFKPLTELGVNVVYIPNSTSIDSIKNDIRTVGKATGTTDKAEQVVKQLEDEIALIQSAIKASGENGPSVYFEIAAAPDIYSFGRGTFLNEMLELLGAQNILSDMDNWVNVSEEIVIKRNPDVILTNIGYLEDPVVEIMNRNGWNVIEAVKNNRVYKIENDASSRPNMNIIIAFREMARALYPEVDLP